MGTVLTLLYNTKRNFLLKKFNKYVKTIIVHLIIINYAGKIVFKFVIRMKRNEFFFSCVGTVCCLLYCPLPCQDSFEINAARIFEHDSILLGLYAHAVNFIR